MARVMVDVMQESLARDPHEYKAPHAPRGTPPRPHDPRDAAKRERREAYLKGCADTRAMMKARDEARGLPLARERMG
ncbi:hypothetical protein [Afifella sp. H1R]|uniref:hypothetical protein n=1 Tax=Afifella sp. H1R TaxID=2908841 RepID=UPI001F2E310D|nr:hypothetical protein [Afifella sp. H1R]